MKGGDRPVPAANAIDAERADEQDRDLRDVGHRSGAQRLPQTQVINGVVETRHPIIQAVGDEEGARPKRPYDQRASPIKLREKFAPSSALHQACRRSGRGSCRNRNSAVGAGFDFLDNRFRFPDAALGDQPSRRFRKARHQEGDQQSWNASQQKNGIPSIGRHEPCANLSRGHEPHRKNHFVQQEKPSSSVRA